MSKRDAGLQVEGGRQLRASLKRAGIKLDDLKAAHKAAAEVVQSHAVAPNRTGRLAASTRSAGTQSAAIVRAGGAAVPYAGPIHWGWPDRGIEAQPWIYDAAQASRDQWEGVYMDAVQHIINEIEGVPGL